MYLNSKVSNAVRYALTATTFFGFSAHSVAQDNTDQAVAVEKIQVTGSRILREGAIAPSPVTVISGADLVETGAMNIGEVLNELPSLAATFSLGNSGRSIGTAGLSILDLRGMGTSRTLVLVDGRRHVASSAGSASVDTNTIPTAWLDSVEIITGGASAVYGADAVTGVVNFRLKKNITGVDFSATKGKGEEGPYKNDKVSLSFGQDFADGRGNIAFAAEYASQDGMNANDRDQTRTPYMSVRNPASKDARDENGVFVHDGIADNITLYNTGWLDNLPGGNTYVDGNWYAFDPDGSVRLQNVGQLDSTGYKCTDCEFLNLTRYVELQPTFDRMNLNTKGTFEVSEALNLFAEAKYVRTRGQSIGQPAFYDATNAPVVIQRDNAFIHQSLATLMDANNLDSIELNRFLEDAGRRTEDNTRSTKRFVLGADGVFGDDWAYEAYGLFGETRLKQWNRNNLVRDNFDKATDAIRLSSGEIVCRDEAARAKGCVPVSLFGDGSISEEGRNWINTTSYGHSTIRQTVFNASVNNSALFELPAGFMGFSAGVEYRKEESETVPDAFASTGATFFNAFQYSKGDFNVKEVFAEISAPLLTDLPFVDELLFDAAVRYADYSTIGSATSWKAGLDWTITSELRMRATYSEALRAPNIEELYGPQDQTFFRNIDDPCALDNKQTATRVANCKALGIAEDFVLNDPGASVEGLTGGNPNLNAEESQSYTVGLVYQPEFVQGLSLTLDYWSIEIDDAIDAVKAQDILNKCVDSASGLNNQFCSLIKRDPNTKQLDLITTIYQNVAAQTAKGVDFELGYDVDVFGGRLNSKLVGTYLESRRTYSFQDAPGEFEEEAGTEGDAQWQANLSLKYSLGEWSASWRTLYVDAVSRYSEQDLAINPDPSDNMGYGSYFLSNAQVAYQFDNGIKLAVGIDNLFDRNLPSFTRGTTEFTGLYNNIGRMYFTTASYKF
ncbi:TonB-dependent receptor [Bowmanella denitrificans]|uniref:TonB-dependent receptor n=1 Tax=Bowmanella denitrificans TaxID=366582 RepID=A0ABP3GMW6_9ALTE